MGIIIFTWLGDREKRRMRTGLHSGVLLLALALIGTSAWGQQTQGALARDLSSENREVRYRAFYAAQALDPSSLDEELREALIKLLDRLNTVVANAIARKQIIADVENPEFIAHVARAVADLKDPRAIVVLSRAIYGSFPAARGLARFGQRAVPAVLEMMDTPNIHHDYLDYGLTTLRLVVERAEPGELSPDTISKIRRTAKVYLSGRPYFTTIWAAMDLAATLNDPELTEVLKSLASDPNEVVLRGITPSDLIERTRKRASDLLAKAKAMPRR